MKIARVFPRKTNMTPNDELVYFDRPPMLILPEIDEVHISVTFTWDLEKSEQLADAWSVVGVPVKIGGPAFNKPGGEFVPGRYLKKGCVITSRGCKNRCWFCNVPKREGYKVKELTIHDGYNIMDDNILATSEMHQNMVYDMLARQTEKPIFSGGLEAKLMTEWQAKRILELKPSRMYFAYDTPDDYEPLVNAGKLLMEYGYNPGSHVGGCYVLIGYHGDTFEKADKRIQQAADAGFMPYAMLYRDGNHEPDHEWKKFQRCELRSNIVSRRMAKWKKNA